MVVQKKKTYHSITFTIFGNRFWNWPFIHSVASYRPVGWNVRLIHIVNKYVVNVLHWKFCNYIWSVESQMQVSVDVHGSDDYSGNWDEILYKVKYTYFYIFGGRAGVILRDPRCCTKEYMPDSYTIPIVQPTRYACYLKLFILVKRSKRFGRSFRPSSGAQNCVYSNGVCQTAAATCCYRRWCATERPSEKCRAFYKNK